MNSKCNFTEYVARIGQDNNGMIFLVLDWENLCDSGFDTGFAIAIIKTGDQSANQTNKFFPGKVIHSSHVKFPRTMDV